MFAGSTLNRRHWYDSSNFIISMHLDQDKFVAFKAIFWNACSQMKNFALQPECFDIYSQGKFDNR